MPASVPPPSRRPLDRLSRSVLAAVARSGYATIDELATRLRFKPESVEGVATALVKRGLLRVDLGRSPDGSPWVYVTTELGAQRLEEAQRRR